MLRIDRRTMDAMRAHAEETFPEECCGVLLLTPEGCEARRLTNVQNQIHADDPIAYPRDARTAYEPEPREWLRVNRDADRPGWRLEVIYHSHPSHDAYFSATDKARALSPWSDPAAGPEPAYPGVVHVVLSVYEGAVRDVRAYAWDDQARDFVEVALDLASA